MFDKLRSALNSFPNQIINKNNDKNTIDDILWNLEVSLLESDVSHEVVEELIKNLKNRISELNFNDSNDKFNLIKDELILIISSLLSNSSNFNLIEEIHKKKSSNEPYLIVFVGINGTGKTTTLAKLAQLLKNNELTCVLACADTYRAGAIEQLIEHSNRLSLKTISQSYGSDPAAVARDAIIYSKSNNIDVVLIDTAGRMQTNQNLMDEIKKIIRVSTPDLKIFVGDALAGNDVVLQAKTFSESVNFDAIILTKIDADVKGGSALSISFVTGKPILYLGNGQDYDSLKPFNVNNFISLLFDDIDQPK
jgi:fused signal recognition particle receptor|tara:strand:- start:1246 stop:2169 length:924 start_codon:yes stop_codon:yes gene_type:complete